MNRDAGFSNFAVFTGGKNENVLGKRSDTGKRLMQVWERFFIDDDADGDSTVTGTIFKHFGHGTLGGLNFDSAKNALPAERRDSSSVIGIPLPKIEKIFYTNGLYTPGTGTEFS